MEQIVEGIHASIREIRGKMVGLPDPNGDIQSFATNSKALEAFLDSDLFRNGNKILGLEGLNFISKYLTELKELLSNHQKLAKRKNQIYLSASMAKLKMLVDHIDYCFLLDLDDFHCLPEDHSRKIAVESITTRIQVAEKEVLASQTQKFLKLYNTLKAVVWTTLKYPPSTSRDLLTGWLIFYYSTIGKKKVRPLAALFDNKARIEHIKLFWNITESKLSRRFMGFTFDSINFHRLIFIPRLVPEVLADQKKQNEVHENMHYTELISQEPILAGAKHSLFQDPSSIRVPLRINSAVPLHKLLHDELREDSCSCCSSLGHEGKKLERLIIHIHGGGFIGQSTYSHQNYTRKWANGLGEAIISVEYRLAPENKFPDGLDDAWQAYTWLVKYSHKFLGIVPHKIILIGDSAGGTLATGITMRAIETGFRPPDAVLLIYPAMNFKIENISQAALMCLDDEVLSHGIFFEVRKYYVRDMKEIDSPYVSPICCEEKVLEKFPKTEFMITMDDPLHGDSIRFAEKLLRAGRSVRITEYPGAIHGALSLGNKEAIPCLSRFVEDSIEILKRLIG